MRGKTNAISQQSVGELELLWTNTSTSQPFSSLTLPLTAVYSGFVIDAKHTKTTQDSQYIRNYFSNTETNRPLVGGRYGSGTQSAYWDLYADRMVNISSSQLSIGTDYYSNDRDIPLRIYGIKSN